MNNWITSLFNVGGRQPLLNMFGRRRNNRGMIWGSLLGMGVSAAAYGLSKSRKRNILSPLSLMNNFGIGQSAQKPKMAGITEFAKELVPNKINNK